MAVSALNNVKVLGIDSPQRISIHGGVIAGISNSKDEMTPGDIDGCGNLILPSFINIHTHLDKSGLAHKIINESGTVTEARTRLREYKKRMEKEDIKERARNTILDALQGGVTAIRTHIDIDPDIGLKGIEAILELREEFSNYMVIDVVAFPQEGITESPGTLPLMEEALRLGANVVGGHLSIAKDFKEHSRILFDLAEKFDRDLDVHVDYDIDRDYSILFKSADGIEYPTALGVVPLAEETICRCFQGRVSASHLCGLDAIVPPISDRVIDLIAKARMNAIALVPNNLYCHGRADLKNVRRGVTKVKTLLNRGVHVAIGSDNIRDPFNPLGSANIIQTATLSAYACHMATQKEFEKLTDMFTIDAAKIMNLQSYGLKIGCNADLSMVEAASVEEMFAKQSNVRYTLKKGEIITSNDIIKKQFFGLLGR